MGSPSKLYIFCSVLMSLLFAYSASVQLNDTDWYFWLPLYTGACAVTLLNWAISSSAIRIVAEAELCLGMLLFSKVVLENGLWSLDMSERAAREKIGSALVVVAMVLQLMASPNKFPRSVDFGMVMLLGLSYGLPFVFFVIQKGEMKFD